jgi:hypothetical protein
MDYNSVNSKNDGYVYICKCVCVCVCVCVCAYTSPFS